MQLITMADDYCAEKVKSLTAGQYQELREKYKDLELPEDISQMATYFSLKLVGTAEDLQYLTDLGFKICVSRVRGLFTETLPELGVPDPGDRLQIVNITIPNAGLFAVQELMVLENDCTNHVQSYLDKGWRIVAVCPPNDTRRPTFILGHMNKANS